MATVRESWVDTAKGIAIIFVVLFHSVLFMGNIGLGGKWTAVSGLLDTFRMPLFFFTAGLFAPKALRMGFRDLFRHRLARLFWLYLLWSLIYVVVFQFVPIAESGGPTWLGFVLIPIWPNPSTWFIYALALFFIITWLMRSWPIWVQFLPALALTLLFGSNLLNSGSEPLDKMATYYVFFLAAVHFGTIARQLAPRVRVWHTLVLLVVYAAIAAVLVLTNIDFIPGIRLVASVLAVVTGCAIAVVLDRLSAFAWLTGLGSRTLPIYLLHFYPILIGAALLAPFAAQLEDFSLLFPPVMTVVAILVSLGIWRLTRRVPGLYELPARWQASAPKATAKADA